MNIQIHLISAVSFLKYVKNTDWLQVIVETPLDL